MPRCLPFLALVAIGLATAPAAALRRMAVPAMHGAGVPETELRGLGNVVLGAVSTYPDTQVVSESDIGALLGLERQKLMLGCDDEACLAQIGGALGVGYLVTSEASHVGSQYVLSLALLDVVHARTLARSVRRTRSLEEAIDDLDPAVREILSHLPENTREKRVAPWLLAGSGVAVAIAGGVLYGLAWSGYGDAKAHPGTCDERCIANGNAEARVGVTGLVAGAAMALGGVLWARTPPESAK